MVSIGENMKEVLNIFFYFIYMLVFIFIVILLASEQKYLGAIIVAIIGSVSAYYILVKNIWK